MKKSNPILSITLDGFQVFDKPTYIPLDRLTLIFGPNSAGKSAVQDAIELYSKLLATEMPMQGLPHELEDLFERHWRRTGGDEDRRVEKLSISVIHTAHCVIDQAVCSDLNRTELGANEIELPLQLESRWHFLRSEGDGDALLPTWNFEFFIESELVVSRIGTELCVNLEHPILRNIEKRVDFSKVAIAHPKEVSYRGGHVTTSEGIAGFHPSGLGMGHSRWFRDQSGYSDFGFDKAYGGSPLLVAAMEEIGLIVGAVLSASHRNSNFQPFKVEASRKVPTRSELTFELGYLDDPMHRLALDGDKAFKTLADSLTSDLIMSLHFSADAVRSNNEYAVRVNRALSDHLFLEQGYRIDYDFRVLMSKANSQAAVVGSDLNPSEFGYLVELFLRDGKGRKHLVEDVGSGIGYVLPVLCAIYGMGSYRSSPCFIQQPELHIHPALQAAMGDVFIEASGADKQILVETHSEHMLLRVLKRIRQTHLQANIAQELKISADDVCVLYFDPSSDGTTTVKRLRITEDGEFMDRWPRGFFGERDQELLDE